jgi:hypothetical protein
LRSRNDPTPAGRKGKGKRQVAASGREERVPG